MRDLVPAEVAVCCDLCESRKLTNFSWLLLAIYWRAPHIPITPQPIRMQDGHWQYGGRTCIERFCGGEIEVYFRQFCTSVMQ